MIPAPDIVRAAAWGAVPPSGAITHVGKPNKIIFHHTAGLASTTNFAYARSVQRDHMSRTPPYKDSGHNFMVMRDGQILEGRHGSVAAITRGEMVESAHCPTQNDQPGIEHEHVSGPMTLKQFNASIALHAWICDRCGIRPTQILPHRMFVNTSCPGELGGDMTKLRVAVAARLSEAEDDVTKERVLELEEAHKHYLLTDELPGPLTPAENAIFYGFGRRYEAGLKAAGPELLRLRAKIAAAQEALK